LALLGNRLWYSPWHHPEGLVAGVVDLVKQLKKHIPEGTSNPILETSVSTSQISVTNPKPANPVNFDSVKLPENLGTPLGEDRLKPEKIATWTVEKKGNIN